MIVTMNIPAATQRKIRRDQRLAKRAPQAIAGGIEAAVTVGAEEIRQKLVTGALGLTMQHPGSGLAASVMGWMIDRNRPLGALGVPGNSPAAAYAGILQRGGTIVPVRAKALAIPVSEEAKQYSSPRDMQGLDLIPRKGRPPLLVRQLSRRGQVRGFELHWVLVKSVRIPAFAWLSRGAEAAKPAMRDAFADELGTYAEKW